MVKNTNKKSGNNKSTIDIDINDAIEISEKLEKIKIGTTLSKDEVEALHKGAQLIGMLITIYSKWCTSKKKMNKLLRSFFGNKSEKTSDLQTQTSDTVEATGDGPSDGNTTTRESKDSKDNNDDNQKKKNRRKGGGGKKSSDAYEGAAEITCLLDDDKMPGKICPECEENKLFEVEPKKTIRLVGNAPVTAFKFIQQKVICICGAFFRADVGAEYRDIYDGEKYSPSALAAIMIHKYLMGVTFGKLEKVQAMNGVPVPATTQMNKIKDLALPMVQAVLGVLSNLASNAGILIFDDTRIRTLEKRLTKEGKETHNGHGTAVIAGSFDNQDNEIILFNLDVNKHAGDVICDLLAGRKRDSLPLLASDGLPAYNECKKDGIDVNCNTHARRKMVEEDPKMETYVGNAVLNCYKEIYANDACCKEHELSDIERMEYHKENSNQHFEKIKMVFDIITGEQTFPEIRRSFEIPDYLVEDEPNGELYNTAKYFIDRYKSLTQVMRYPGVPLDTNHVERMIKSLILLRKTSLFFNNNFSAQYSGDILSLLETANQNGQNVFDYMDYLLSNKSKVLENPHNFLPWIYKESEDVKKQYWDGVDIFMKSPSNFQESSYEKSFHSSA